MQEAREIMSDLSEALDDVPDVVKRMLNNEAHFDAAAWARRIRTSLNTEGEPSGEQSDFFE